MAKLKNRHTARLIDVWVPGNSGNNPGNYHWIKKLVILILLLVILIFLTSLWNYYDVSFKEKTPSSLVNESLITAPIIGKPGKNIPLANAYGHIFGYTIMNDFSGRDLKLHPDRKVNHWIEWLNGKWLDGFCPAGPWIVVAEDIADPNNLQLTTKIKLSSFSREATVNAPSVSGSLAPRNPKDKLLTHCVIIPGREVGPRLMAHDQ